MLATIRRIWSRRWRSEYYAVPKLRSGRWQHDEWASVWGDLRVLSGW